LYGVQEVVSSTLTAPTNLFLISRVLVEYVIQEKTGRNAKE
jgi:hypothetical protein